MPYTVTVIGPDAEGVDPEHPDARQQAKIVEAWRNLPPGYHLAYCTGPRCEWFLRLPDRVARERDCTAADYGHMHLGSAHLDDLIAGHACLDPELASGAGEYLRRRLALVLDR